MGRIVHVRAIRDFTHGDRSIRTGQIVELQATDAAILARQSKVSLEKLHTSDIEAEAAPEPAPEPDPPTRRRRTYRRRDLVPEP